eukprot:365563-Chlamydomonas_euryale.AAC.9
MHAFHQRRVSCLPAYMHACLLCHPYRACLHAWFNSLSATSGGHLAGLPPGRHGHGTGAAAALLLQEQPCAIQRTGEAGGAAGSRAEGQAKGGAAGSRAEGEAEGGAAGSRAEGEAEGAAGQAAQRTAARQAVQCAAARQLVQHAGGTGNAAYKKEARAGDKTGGTETALTSTSHSLIIPFTPDPLPLTSLSSLRTWRRSGGSWSQS